MKQLWKIIPNNYILIYGWVILAAAPADRARSNVLFFLIFSQILIFNCARRPLRATAGGPFWSRNNFNFRRAHAAGDKRNE